MELSTYDDYFLNITFWKSNITFWKTIIFFRNFCSAGVPLSICCRCPPIHLLALPHTFSAVFRKLNLSLYSRQRRSITWRQDPSPWSFNSNGLSYNRGRHTLSVSRLNTGFPSIDNNGGAHQHRNGRNDFGASFNYNYRFSGRWVSVKNPHDFLVSVSYI